MCERKVAEATRRRIELLGAAKAELADALEELRELARGIHPAILTDRGLVPALEMLAGRASIPVERRRARRAPAAERSRRPPTTSSPRRHQRRQARAGVARPGERRPPNGRVLVEVADDGVGGADQRRGSGLRGLRDRVEALGGELALESPAGAGTTLTARLPVA